MLDRNPGTDDSHNVPMKEKLEMCFSVLFGRKELGVIKRKGMVHIVGGVLNKDNDVTDPGLIQDFYGYRTYTRDKDGKKKEENYLDIPGITGALQDMNGKINTLLNTCMGIIRASNLSKEEVMPFLLEIDENMKFIQNLQTEYDEGMIKHHEMMKHNGENYASESKSVNNEEAGSEEKNPDDSQ